MKRRECLTLLGALAVGSATMGRVLPVAGSDIPIIYGKWLPALNNVAFTPWSAEDAQWVDMRNFRAVYVDGRHYDLDTLAGSRAALKDLGVG